MFFRRSNCPTLEAGSASLCSYVFRSVISPLSLFFSVRLFFWLSRFLSACLPVLFVPIVLVLCINCTYLYLFKFSVLLLGPYLPRVLITHILSFYPVSPLFLYLKASGIRIKLIKKFQVLECWMFSFKG